MIAKRMEGLYPSRYASDIGVTRTPILLLQTPPDQRRFYQHILASIGAPKWRRHTVSELEVRALSHLRDMDLKMIMIDEVQSLLAGSYREQRRFPNMLRFLANDLCPLCPASGRTLPAALVRRCRVLLAHPDSAQCRSSVGIWVSGRTASGNNEGNDDRGYRTVVLDHSIDVRRSQGHIAHPPRGVSVRMHLPAKLSVLSDMPPKCAQGFITTIGAMLGQLSARPAGLTCSRFAPFAAPAKRPNRDRTYASMTEHRGWSRSIKMRAVARYNAPI